MRIIFKLIFRLDFDVNFDVIDQRGQVFKCILSDPPDDNKFWANMHEAVDRSSIKGTYRGLGEYRDITIEPTNISGVIEDARGIPFEKITENEIFKQYDQIIANYKEHFGLNKVRRAGLRLFLFENYGDNFTNQAMKFRKILNDGFLKSFNENIGEIEDTGITFDGTTADGLNYHLNFGHFYENDIGKFIHKAPMDEEMHSKLLKNHVTVDFDLYEHDISFSGLSLKRWCKDKWPVIDSFMVKYREHMING